MSLGNILGQILQQGMGQSSQTPGRLENATRNLGAGGGGIDSIFGQIQDALGNAGGGAPASGRGVGGFAEMARDFLQKDQVGGFSGAQVGGIGAAAGALLGGGLGGAARGGAMAVLGTLALSALKAARAHSGQGTPDITPDTTPDTSGGGFQFDPAEVKSLTGPDTEKLVLRAMISAAKADGNIDKAEMEKLVGRLGQDGVTEEEKRFVMDELEKPLDVAALARSVRTPAQGAEVYAASLLAISVDSAAEQSYLRELAGALRLDQATVGELHRLTGVRA